MTFRWGLGVIVELSPLGLRWVSGSGSAQQVVNCHGRQLADQIAPHLAFAPFLPPLSSLLVSVRDHTLVPWRGLSVRLTGSPFCRLLVVAMKFWRPPVCVPRSSVSGLSVRRLSEGPSSCLLGCTLWARCYSLPVSLAGARRCSHPAAWASARRGAF